MSRRFSTVGIAGLVAFCAAAYIVLEAMAQDFKSHQLTFPRVRKAAANKQQLLREIFQQKGLAYPPRRIFIRVFKQEKQLEVWAGPADESPLALVKTYPVCETSGTLGPKRRQGDNQIPEGFYVLENFNPLSNYHLSLRVNYPNRADRIAGKPGPLGGDIYIHGNCVTIGCVPITDDGIEEVYWLAVESRAAGQAQIPVHLFPARLTAAEFHKLEDKWRGNVPLLHFWAELKPAFDYFEKHRKVPKVEVSRDGKYRVVE